MPNVSSAGAVSRLESVLDRKQMQAGGRESTLLRVRAWNQTGQPVSVQVALKTSSGQFLVQRTGACQPGDLSARCVGAALATTGAKPAWNTEDNT